MSESRTVLGLAVMIAQGLQRTVAVQNGRQANIAHRFRWGGMIGLPLRHRRGSEWASSEHRSPVPVGRHDWSAAPSPSRFGMGGKRTSLTGSGGAA